MTTCSQAHSMAKPCASAAVATASITSRCAPAPIPSAGKPIRNGRSCYRRARSQRRSQSVESDSDYPDLVVTSVRSVVRMRRRAQELLM